MARERTHYEGCWRSHNECRRTVLDEAAYAIHVATAESVTASGDTPPWLTDRQVAAVVLTVAADRLRVERDAVNPPAYPPNEYLDGLRAGYGNAADMLTEGVTDAH